MYYISLLHLLVPSFFKRKSKWSWHISQNVYSLCGSQWHVFLPGLILSYLEALFLANGKLFWFKRPDLVPVLHLYVARFRYCYLTETSLASSGPLQSISSTGSKLISLLEPGNCHRHIKGAALPFPRREGQTSAFCCCGSLAFSPTPFLSRSYSLTEVPSVKLGV